MNIFGTDDSVTCVLIDVRGGNEQDIFFDVYRHVGAPRYNWRDQIFWANDAQTHKIIVFCSTDYVYNNANVLSNILPANLATRRDQAKNAGFTFFDVQIGDTYSMVYY